MSQDYTVSGQAVACSRFLPAKLIEARASAFNPLNLLDLNITARRVLYGILTFLSVKNLKSAIFPRRDTLRAESLLQSDSTLYRGLSLLEQKGYITREQIRKVRDGKFYLSPIALTDKALLLLDLQKDIHSPRPAKVKDGHIKKEHTNIKQSLQNTTGEADSSDKNGIDKKSGLPRELLRLLPLGVKKSAICWLMRHARVSGKRLGDIVDVVWHSINSLRGREVVAYLAALIRKNVDFAWAAKEKQDVAVTMGEEASAKRTLDAIDARYVGHEVVAHDGTSLGVIRHEGSMVVRAPDGAIPVNLRFVRAWLEGKIQIRPPATSGYVGHEL